MSAGRGGGSRSGFSPPEVERYARHLMLKEVGGPGQQRLRDARVLIVGAGGLGGPAALYLAAAGVGIIGLADPDTVALSNLQRQVQFATEDLGRPKVSATAERLVAVNPHVEVRAYPVRVGGMTAASLAADFDMVLDGTDDFETRAAVNAACVETGRPLVSGALGRWTGQVGVFEGRPCWRCLVPETPPDAETCAALGVIGALAGVVSSLMALEAVKLVTGAGDPLRGRLWLYDGLSATTRVVKVAADPACDVCGVARQDSGSKPMPS